MSSTHETLFGNSSLGSLLDDDLLLDDSLPAESLFELDSLVDGLVADSRVVSRVMVSKCQKNDESSSSI